MSIEYIRHEYIKNSETLQKIYNLKNDYWWSDDFSPLFYIDLAIAGFITVTHEHNGELLLIPEIQREYALLDFKDLHISKKVQKLIDKNEYTLTIYYPTKNIQLLKISYSHQAKIQSRKIDLKGE